MDPNPAYGDINVIQLPPNTNLSQLIQQATVLSVQQQQQSVPHHGTVVQQQLQQPSVIMLQLVPGPACNSSQVVSPHANGFSSCVSVAGQPAQQQITPVVHSEEEPLYVNAKQYYRILKRRADRAKLEQEGRIPKERRKYMHESRHLHALNRARGDGGRFGTSNKKSPSKRLIKTNIDGKNVANRMDCDESVETAVPSFSAEPTVKRRLSARDIEAGIIITMGTDDDAVDVALVLRLVQNTAYLHCHKMLDILLNDVMSYIDDQWLEYLRKFDFEHQLKILLNTETQPDLCPSTLRQFLMRCRYASSILKINEEIPTSKLAVLDKALKLGISEKKIHELERFVPKVIESCLSQDCNLVIDIGCGLGHLSKVLCSNDSPVKRIIALDASSSLCEKASYNFSEDRNTSVQIYNIRLDGSNELLELLRSRIKDLENELGNVLVNMVSAIENMQCYFDS